MSAVHTDLVKRLAAAGARAALCVAESPAAQTVHTVAACGPNDVGGVTLNSAFLAGSQAKMYTAAAVALLVNSRALNLETPVHRHMPECPAGIDVRALLTHTSGLGDHVTEIVKTRNPVQRADWSTSELVALAIEQSGTRARGEFAYSNTGYLLLARLVERISGVSLAEFAAQRIFGPLGMLHTRFVNSDTPAMRALLPQMDARLQAAGARIGALELLALAHGSGNLVTTLADSLAFGRELLRDEPRLSLPISGEQDHFLPGIQSFAMHGMQVFGHRAQFVSTTSATLFAPAKGVVVAYCVQHDSQPDLKPGTEILQTCQAMVERAFALPCSEARVF